MDIHKLAQECFVATRRSGSAGLYSCWSGEIDISTHIDRFAALVVEECAKICDARAESLLGTLAGPDVAQDLADEIRAQVIPKLAK